MWCVDVVMCGMLWIAGLWCGGVWCESVGYAKVGMQVWGVSGSEDVWEM